MLSFSGDDFQETDFNTQLQIFGTKFMGELCCLKDILVFLHGLSDGQQTFFSKCVGLLNLV